MRFCLAVMCLEEQLSQHVTCVNTDITSLLLGELERKTMSINHSIYLTDTLPSTLFSPLLLSGFFCLLIFSAFFQSVEIRRILPSGFGRFTGNVTQASPSAHPHPPCLFFFCLLLLFPDYTCNSCCISAWSVGLRCLGLNLGSWSCDFGPLP